MGKIECAGGVILLYSYRRPEFTDQAIQRLLEWENLHCIYVSIDGLRASADNREKNWRKQTIGIVERWASQTSRVIPMIWENNDGLTAHGIRAFNEIMPKYGHLISLEEDNLISNDGLDFLHNHVCTTKEPMAATSYSKYQHPNMSHGQRATWFPEQWGTSFNLAFYNEFLKIWKSKEIDPLQFQKVLYPLFGKNKKVDRAIAHWVSEFKSAIYHESWGDAIFAYTATKIGTPYAAPWNTYTEDLGFQDPRGLNQRNRIDVIAYKHKPKFVKFNDGVFCLKCDGRLFGIYKSTFIKKFIRKIRWEFYKRRSTI